MNQTKPFRIIVNKILSSWVIWRTDAQGKSIFVARTGNFSEVFPIIDLLLDREMLCRKCKGCEQPFSPVKITSFYCSTGCKTEHLGEQNNSQLIHLNKENKDYGLHEERRDSETLSGRRQSNEEPSRSGAEELNRDDYPRNEKNGLICLTADWSFQKGNQSRQERDKPQHRPTNISSPKTSSQVPAIESTGRHDSEVKPLRAKELQMKPEGGNYRCRYCGLMKFHKEGVPFPSFCRPCQATIEKDKRDSKQKAKTYKTIEVFKNSGRYTKEI